MSWGMPFKTAERLSVLREPPIHLTPDAAFDAYSDASLGQHGRTSITLNPRMFSDLLFGWVGWNFPNQSDESLNEFCRGLWR
jgi:hypothetical protein